MFNREKPTPSERASSSATLISSGTIVNGDLVSDSDLRIDGTINGSVSSSAKIVIGPSGYVEGNLEGEQADITGRVVGNIKVAELLQLRGSCQVQGNISAGKLQIEPSATFNGQCQMGITEKIVQLPSHEFAAES